jgi:hypothetical protein
MSTTDSHPRDLRIPSCVLESELSYSRYIAAESNNPMLAPQVERAKECLAHLRGLIRRAELGEDITLALAMGRMKSPNIDPSQQAFMLPPR